MLLLYCIYCLYLNAYFDYSTAKEYEYNIPFRGNCGRKLEPFECVGGEGTGEATLLPFLKETTFSSCLNK